MPGVVGVVGVVVVVGVVDVVDGVGGVGAVRVVGDHLFLVGPGWALSPFLETPWGRIS